MPSSTTRCSTSSAASGWQDAGGRRIQFYGHWYDHAKGGVYRVGDLPDWAARARVASARRTG